MITREEYYKKFRKAKVFNKDEIIISKIKGKTVLDVGCIGQDRDHLSEYWLHNIIKKHALQVTGVDIVEQKIYELRKAGYNILHINDLEKVKDSYDVIIMADVIEHINDPVGFIRYYVRFLKENGIIIISTPNAKRAFDFINILLSNKYWHNEEHTFWLCPKTMLEVAERAGVYIDQFYWLKYYKHGEIFTFKVWLIRKISNILMKFQKNFNENFMVILKPAL